MLSSAMQKGLGNDHRGFGIWGGLLGGILCIYYYIHVLLIYTNNMIYFLHTNEGKWRHVCSLSVATSSICHWGLLLLVLSFQKRKLQNYNVGGV
jgi:hypothetical protein